MTVQLALLRAINVGGRNKLPMAELKSLCLEMGISQPETYLQTGNLLFEATLDEAFKKKFLKRLEAKFGFCPTVIFHEGSYLDRTVIDNPFVELSETNPNQLLVFFLDQKPNLVGLAVLEAAIKGEEKIVLVEDRLYVSYYPHGVGKSKLTPSIIEKKLGVEGTSRNWNTVLKIQDRVHNR
ncbi:MAG: DUF1697 domain-containing protein [Halopseudomonas aestusnigri]